MAHDSFFTLPVAIAFAAPVKLFELMRTPPFHPVVTGALLFTLTRAPPQIREPILANLTKYASSSIIEKGITALKTLFALGLARKLHLYLTELAQNNFRFTSEASKYDWPNEIALVTGAAGGIGAAIVTDLADKGLKVIAVDIAPELPSSLLKNDRIHYHRCDITSRSAVMDLAETIRSDHGDVSILVNNAGIGFAHHTLNASEKDLRRLWDVNILSHYWTVQAFLPAMLEKKKGHIVSTASMASFYPTPGLGPYSGTKVAALNLHESLAQELRVIYNAPDILLTIVHPTFVDTAMVANDKEELQRRRHTIITAQDVSRGICGNIFRGRGGQVILAADLGWIPTIIRALPWWLSYALLRAVQSRQVHVPEVERALK